MQQTNLNDIRHFLNNEKWILTDNKLNDDFNHQGHALKYDVETYYSGGSNSTIMILHKENKKNIILGNLAHQCYISLLSSFDLKKAKTTNADEIKKITFREGDITVEFIEEDYNRFILVYNAKFLNAQVQQIKIEEEYFLDLINQGDSLFLHREFEKAKTMFASALGMSNDELVESKISECELAICNELISKSDSLVEINEFETALNKLFDAKKCTQKLNVVETKINEIKKLILNNTIQQKKIYADELFYLEKYDSSIAIYKSILELDKNNSFAVEQIKNVERKKLKNYTNQLLSKAEAYLSAKNYDSAWVYFKSIKITNPADTYAEWNVNRIEKIQKTMQERKTRVFSYRSTNGMDLNNFKNLISENLNLRIQEKNRGFLDVRFTIAFDTSGNNLSYVKNLNTSFPNYQNYISKLALNGTLKPSTENGFYLAAEEILACDVKWSTERLKYNSKFSGIEQSNKSTQIPSPIYNFINSQTLKYGKFTIDLKEKESDGRTFTDMHLVKHKVVGPRAALLSIVFPTLGSRKVSYGASGRGRLKSFLLMSTLAIGSKFYSKNQYDAYNDSTNHLYSRGTLLENARIAETMATVFGGISATLYIYDILWAFSKGIKNIKQSRPIKRSLKNGPVQIQNQPISIN